MRKIVVDVYFFVLFETLSPNPTPASGLCTTYVKTVYVYIYKYLYRKKRTLRVKHHEQLTIRNCIRILSVIF